MREFVFLIDGEDICSTISREKKSALITLKRRNAHNMRKNWEIHEVKQSKMNQPGFRVDDHAEIPFAKKLKEAI